MKFSCERCGKKYATAEEPAPGRVYKLKCKACGHLIVVKATTGEAPPPPPAEPPPAEPPRPEPAATLEAPPDPGPAPEIQLEVGTPEPAAVIAGAASDLGPAAPPPLDATTEVSAMTVTVEAPEENPPAGQGEGYVELFGEGSSPGMPPEPPRERLPEDDPFLAAARASLPESYGAGNPSAPDPFAPLRDELAVSAAAPNEPAPYRSTTKVPHIPRPAEQKSALPLVLIAVGVLVLMGILGFVLISGKKADPPPKPVARAREPAVSPAPAAPAQEAPPAAAEPPPREEAAPPPGGGRRAAEERRRAEREEAQRREAQARAEREARERAAREARERERLEREERARREAERREAERVAAASIPTPEVGLSQAQIEKVVLSTRKAFDGCIEQAKAGGVKLDGRRVLLRLNIQTSGAVTYPTLDDVTLNSTDLGSCLKSAARLMVFPKFKGDTLHIEVPVVLR